MNFKLRTELGCILSSFYVDISNRADTLQSVVRRRDGSKLTKLRFTVPEMPITSPLGSFRGSFRLSMRLAPTKNTTGENSGWPKVAHSQPSFMQRSWLNTEFTTQNYPEFDSKRVRRAYESIFYLYSPSPHTSPKRSESISLDIINLFFNELHPPARSCPVVPHELLRPRKYLVIESDG